MIKIMSGLQRGAGLPLRSSRGTAAVAGTALTLLLATGLCLPPASASAQWFGFRYPLYAPVPVESEMSPREVREVLARFGYQRASRPLYDDGIIIVDATNRFGDRERLILDAYTGHLLGRRAVPHRFVERPPIERPRGPAIARVPEAPPPREVEPAPRVTPAPRQRRDASPQPQERPRPPTTVRREPLLPPQPRPDEPRPRVTPPTAPPVQSPRTVTPPAAQPAQPPAAAVPAPQPGTGTREQPRRIEIAPPAPLDDASPRPRGAAPAQPPINSIPPAPLE